MVFNTIIQRNVKLAEAPSHGKTIIMHDAVGKGSINYLNLAREILQRNCTKKIKNALYWFLMLITVHTTK